MLKQMAIAGGLVLAALVGIASFAQTAQPGSLPAGHDWPQWGGADPGRNMVSAETNLPDTFDVGKTDGRGGLIPGSAKNVRWRVSLGSRVYGNPTVAGGKVYVGTTGSGGVSPERFKGRTTFTGRVLCLDEATGKFVWELLVPTSSKERQKTNYLSQEVSSGICSSPAVDGDRVYVLTGNGFLLCLTTAGLAAGNQGPFADEGRWLAGDGGEPIATVPTDADIVWVCDLVEELHIHIHDISSCSVLVHGPNIYLETSNGVGTNHKAHPAPDAPSFIVVDKKTGKIVAADNEKLGSRTFHCLWSPPSLGEVSGRELVFFGGGDGVCYAFDATAFSVGPSTRPADRPLSGTLKKVWSYDCIPAGDKTRDGKLIPYADGDKRKGKNSPNKGDGEYAGPSEIIATPVFYNGRVYVAIGQDPAHGRGRGVLHCIDATKTGDITESGRVWSFDKIERTLSGVAIADGRLYAADLAGHVFCLDAATGRLFWTLDLAAETWSTPLVADGKVYIESEKGVHILSAVPAGDQPRELARVKLDSPSYGSVVAAHGTLFVTSSKSIWAVQK